MGISHFNIAYVDHNTKHSSGIIREKSWTGDGFSGNMAMRSALRSFLKQHKNCDVIRIQHPHSLSMLKRLDENNGEPLTGLGFEPED